MDKPRPHTAKEWDQRGVLMTVFPELSDNAAAKMGRTDSLTYKPHVRAGGGGTENQYRPSRSFTTRGAVLASACVFHRMQV